MQQGSHSPYVNSQRQNQKVTVWISHHRLAAKFRLDIQRQGMDEREIRRGMVQKCFSVALWSRKTTNSDPWWSWLTWNIGFTWAGCRTEYSCICITATQRTTSSLLIVLFLVRSTKRITQLALISCHRIHVTSLISGLFRNSLQFWYVLYLFYINQCFSSLPFTLGLFRRKLEYRT